MCLCMRLLCNIDSDKAIFLSCVTKAWECLKMEKCTVIPNCGATAHKGAAKRCQGCRQIWNYCPFIDVLLHRVPKTNLSNWRVPWTKKGWKTLLKGSVSQPVCRDAHSCRQIFLGVPLNFKESMQNSQIIIISVSFLTIRCAANFHVKICVSMLKKVENHCSQGKGSRVEFMSKKIYPI